MNLINIPYLQQWSSFSGRDPSNLTDMIGYMTAVMTQNPPIDTSPGAMFTNAPGGGAFPQQQMMPQPVANPYETHHAVGRGAGAAPPQPSGPDTSAIFKKIDTENDRFFDSSVKTCNALVSAKVKLHREKFDLEQKL